ncbi:hypothetical protein QJS10_CPA07g00302 [Acorus calamus]|uniref:Uncharacterized protein n=1 Tax=Acorus calamus TaxID=4465 RepID=A0AAV9EDS5_ACOCL|nr:hypothetical protein QJS10_CPA07g00302 [Acorus calamus]
MNSSKRRLLDDHMSKTVVNLIKTCMGIQKYVIRKFEVAEHLASMVSSRVNEWNDFS